MSPPLPYYRDPLLFWAPRLKSSQPNDLIIMYPLDINPSIQSCVIKGLAKAKKMITYTISKYLTQKKKIHGRNLS